MKKPAKLLSQSFTISVVFQRLIVGILIVVLSVVGTSIKTAVAADADQPVNTDSVFANLDTLVTDSYSSYSIPSITKHIQTDSCDDPTLKNRLDSSIKAGGSFGVIESTLSFISHCDQQSLAESYGRPIQVMQLSASDTPLGSQQLLIFEGKRPVRHLGQTDISSYLPKTCIHKTIVATIAHEDDDLLFMNPDLQKHIASGGCMVTIYLTAGDFGHEAIHWQQRRVGSESAYAAMAQQANVWDSHQLTVNGNLVQLSQLASLHNIIHVYMQLPDGGVSGSGFASTGYESLAKFLAQPNATIHTIDKTTTYTKSSLIATLATLFASFAPSAIWTQDFLNTDHVDHSDHSATGEITKRAFYELNHSGDYYVPALKLFTGYQLKTLPKNISDSIAGEKQSIFHEYAIHDITICDTTGRIPCDTYGIYDLYFTKEYSRTFKAQ